MTHRRIIETIGMMGTIVTEVKIMLQNHAEIGATQTLIVNFNTFRPSLLCFFIYAFTRTKEWINFHEVKRDVLLKITGALRRRARPARVSHHEPA